MKNITFDEFYNTYGVKRNEIYPISMYENTMIDLDEEGLEELQDEDPKNIWTLTDTKEEGLVLQPGLMYKGDIIGYFICDKKWNKTDEVYSLK